MSNTIDRKVVEMQFDNAQFEKNVKHSMSTLDKLKSSLKFDGFAKGFDDIEKRSSKLDFSSVGAALDTVTQKFSVLESIALGALMRIGQRAVDTGIELVKSMSVDNIAAGWEKFEDKTKSVGTLIAQGYDMSTVENQLERLNWFTDETSYSFTEMVSSIAKFTATGKKLPDSVDALMGIANWAALSGQNAETASRAMYQLSQAMGSGVMRKEDYKSIQNMSMDTAEFRQIALDTAVAMGTLQKNADGTYQSIVKGAKQSKFTISQFADHLTQDLWFNSDVMMEVYRKYGSAVDTIYNYTLEHADLTASEAIEEIKLLGIEIDDFGLKAFKASQEARTWGDTVESVKEAVASGFMKTYEIIFGNYEEATKLWTDLANRFYDAFAEPINNFNDILQKALKDKDVFIEDYLKSITGANDAASRIRETADEYGYFSDEVNDLTMSLAGNDPLLAKALTHFTRLNSEVSETTKIVGASSDDLIKYVSKLTGASEEEVAKMREIGETYGYRSSKFVKEVQNTFGKSKKSVLEMTSEILSLGAGLDTIESKNVDEFLTNSLNLTAEQVSELRNLSKEYGANSQEVDTYLNSLSNLKNYGYAGLRATKEGIKGILDVTDSLIESTNTWTKGDLAGYLVDLTGASRESVDILLELTSAEDKNIEKIDEWALSIANGDQHMKDLILSIIDMENESDKLLGRQNLIDAFNLVWEHFGAIAGTIRDAFNEIFYGTSDEDGVASQRIQNIYDLTQKIKDLAGALDHSEGRLDKFRRTFKGIFSVFKIIGQVVKAAMIPIKDLFKRFADGDGTLLDATASMGDWLTALAESGKVGETATKIFTKVSEVVQGIVDFLRDFIDISGTIESYNNAGGGLAGVFSVIGDKVKVVLDYVFLLISKLTGWDVSEVKTKVLGFVDRAKQAIQDFLPTQDEMREGWSKIKEVLDKVAGFFGFGKDSVETEGVDTATDAVNDLSDAVGDATSNISTLGDKLSGFFGGFKDIIGTVTDVFSSIKESGVLTGFGSTFEKIGKNLGKLDFSQIVGFAKSGALALMGVGFYKISKNIGSFVDAFSKNGIFGSNSIFNSKNKDWTTKLKNLALAIALLAASLFLISKVDADRVWGSLGILTILVVEMVAVMEIMDHTMKGGGKMSVLSMIAFAASMLILAKAVEKIAKNVPEDRLWESFAVVAALMAVLAGCEALMSFGKTGGKLAGSIGALLFVKAVSNLVEEVVKLADPKYSPERMKTAAMVVGALTLVLGISMMISTFGDWGSILSSGVSAVLFAGAIVAIAREVAKLAEVEGNIWSALIVVGVIAGILDVLSITLSKLGNPSKMLAGASATLIMAAAIDMIAIAVSALSVFDQKKIWSATIAIGLLITVIGAYTYFISQVPAPYVLAAASALAISGFAILELAVAMSIFSGVVAVFSSMAAEDFWKGIGYITASIVALGTAFAIIAPATVVMMLFSTALLIAASAVVVFGVGLTTVAKGLKDMATAILIFGLAVKVGGQDFLNGLGFLLDGFINLIPKIAKAIVGFAVGIGEAILDEMPRIRRVLKELVVNGIGVICDSVEASIPPIVETTLVVIIGVLDALVEHAPELVDKFMTFLIEVLHGVGEHIEELTEEVMTIIIGIINGIANKLPELIEAGAKLVKNLIEGIIKALKDFKIDNIDDLEEAAKKMLGVMTIVGTWSLVFPFAMTGVLALGSLAVAMGLVLAALGGLSKIPGVMGIVEDGGNFLGKIGEAIGKFVGGFIGAGLDEIAKKLPSIGRNLSRFMDNASGFIEGAKDIDSSVIDSVTSLAGALLALTAVEILDGVASMFGLGVDWEEFGKDLSSLGEGLAEFSENTKDIETEHLNKVLDAIKYLVDIWNELPKTEGLLAWLGEHQQNLEEFGKGLSSLTIGITDFAEAAKNITPEQTEAMERVAKALEPIVDLWHKLPEIEGLAPWLKGHQNDLEEFGKGLATLATGVFTFSIAASFVSPEAANNMRRVAYALDPIVTLWHKLPEIEGLGPWLRGHQNDLSEFGTGLATLAIGVFTFSTIAKLVTADASAAMRRVAFALDPIVTLWHKLPEIEGFWPWLKGHQQNLGDFGKGLSSLASGVLSFGLTAIMLKDNHIDSMKRVAEALDPIVDLANKLPNTEGLFTWFYGKQTVEDFAKNLSGLADGVKEFGEHAKGADIQGAVDMLGVIGPALTKIAELGQSLPEGKNQNIGDFGDDLEDLGKGLKKLSDYLKDMPTSGIVVKLPEVMEALSEVSALELNGDALSDFSDDLSDFGDNIKSFEKTWSKISITDLTSALDDVKGLGAKIKEVSTSLETSGNGGFSSFTESLKSMASSGLDGAIETATSKLGEYKDTLTSGLTEAVDEATGKLDSYKDLGKDVMEKIKDGIKNEKKPTLVKVMEDVVDSAVKAFEGIVDGIDGVISDVVNKITSRRSDMYDAGSNFVQGFINGMNSKRPAVGDTAAGIGRTAVNRLKNEVRENSPSKETEQIGEYFGQGFVNGVSDFIEVSGETAAKVGKSALDGLDKAINDSTTFGLDGIDNTVTIKPVLDLTEIQNGTSELDRMMSRFNGYALAGSAELAGSVYNSMGRRYSDDVNPLSKEVDKLSKTVDKLSTQQPVTQNNTFNITGDDPEEIAKEVSKILTRDIKRGDDRWG